MTTVQHLNTAETPRREEPKEMPHTFSLAAISILLMDACNNQVEAAVAEAKNVEANSQVQDRLVRSLAEHKPITIPQDAWEKVRKSYKVLISYWDRKHIFKLHKWVTRYKNTIVPAKNGVLVNIVTKNEEQNKIRQNIQNALNTIQQKGQMNLASMNGNIQGSNQTQSAEIGILDTFLTITQKIFKKQ